MTMKDSFTIVNGPGYNHRWLGSQTTTNVELMSEFSVLYSRSSNNVCSMSFVITLTRCHSVASGNGIFPRSCEKSILETQA